MLRPVRATLCSIALISIACGSGAPASGEQPSEATSSEALVGGCSCVESGSCADLSYSDVPENGLYFFTTFGGPGGGTMSCGGSADGSWAYVAGRARFGCGTKLLIQKNGKSCVAQVADCGPNRCVEQAACYCACADHSPTLAASPLISEYLLGVASAGWSDQIQVAASIVDESSIIGCPGVVATPAGSGGSGGTGAAGGDAGSGGGQSGAASAPGGSGGSAPNECAPPVCACGSCFDDCMCDLQDTTFCANSCAIELADGGIAGADSGGDPSSACTGAPDCGGCASCYDACRCQYKSVKACLEQCTKTDDPGVAGDPTSQRAPELPEHAACAARIAKSSLLDGWCESLVAVALALALRRRRARRAPSDRSRRSVPASRERRARAGP